MQTTHNPTLPRHRLYWIYDDRKPADPLRDGYIGVTTQTVGKRVHSHINNRFSGISTDAHSDQQVGNRAPKKMHRILSQIPVENIQYKEIIWSYDEETIESIERAFRPTKGIGWNSYAGGKPRGTQKPFTMKFNDGRKDETYPSIAAAGRNGHHMGNLSSVLRGKIKDSVVYKTKVRYTAEFINV